MMAMSGIVNFFKQGFGLNGEYSSALGEKSYKE